MSTSTKYTAEEELEIKTSYLQRPTRATVEELSEKYGRSVRSIVSKLVKEGVYVKPRYTTKSGEIPINKEELVELISVAMGVPSEMLEGLEKAPKRALRLILKNLDPESIDLLKAD